MANLKVLSLYTGAGGLDLGLEAAGFDCAVALEMDHEAVQTLRANRDWTVLEEDVHDVSTRELLRAAGLKVRQADLLVGGPPCQPFSKSGYWHSGEAKRLDDPRAATLDEYLRVLREAKPRAFLLENVPGLAFSEKDEGLVLLRETIQDINRTSGTRYSLVAAQLNAVQYGVPQMRERVFVVGHREGREFRFPTATHARPAPIDMANGGIEPAPLEAGLLQPPLTAWDAIGHLDKEPVDPALAVRGKWADLLPSIPEGHNYLFHTVRGGGKAIFGWRRRYWSMLLKLAKNRPSWTLTAQPGPAIGPFHWKSRRLSAAELVALQTFPAGYRVLGGVMSAHRQIGNAVPSALAELLGLEIRRQFFGHPVTPARLTLLPQRRTDCPPPEPPKPVRHKKYLELVGDHPPHPGVGTGPGARPRLGSSANPSAR